MNRNPNIAVVKFGYSTMYAFEDAQLALELMAIMSKAVQVDEEAYSMREYTPCTHFLNETSDMPELKFIAVSKFNPHETPSEAKARFEREKLDREDLNQNMREAPAALPAPSGIPF